VGEDGWGWQRGERVVHIGGKVAVEAAYGTRPGLEVGQGAVIGLSIGLDEVVDV